MRFYLGTHKPNWVGTLRVPLFISYTRLRRRKSAHPRARCNWALDSGAFSELTKHGRWVTTEDEYVEAVHRYRDEIGNMDWAAPMDWMCEPFMIERTGRSVRQHQRLTTLNYLRLRESGLPFIPVVQGWRISDYVWHVEDYVNHGVDLAAFPVVGIGSVCRRQGTKEIAEVFSELASYDLKMHGFGVKTSGLQLYGQHLTSSDSMAWSSAARRREPLPECVQYNLHRGNCANCIRFALKWRRRVLGVLA